MQIVSRVYTEALDDRIRCMLPRFVVEARREKHKLGAAGTQQDRCIGYRSFCCTNGWIQVKFEIVRTYVERCQRIVVN